MQQDGQQDSNEDRIPLLEVDLHEIDNAMWSSNGRIMNYINQHRRLNGQIIDGICVSIRRFKRKRDILGVGHAYQLWDAETKNLQQPKNHLRQLILGDVEFRDDIRSCGLYKLIVLIGIAYGLEFKLSPKDIIYPAGLYGVDAKACRWMRPMDNCEIFRCPPFTRGLWRVASNNVKICGMYCLDSGKLTDVYDEIERIIQRGWRHEKFGINCDIRDIITDKVRSLLSSTSRVASV